MSKSYGWRAAGFVCSIAALLLMTSLGVAQTPTPSPSANPKPAAAGSVGIFNQATFPDRQRPLGNPAVIARGQALFGINCKACHGSDLRGGDLGGPNLLRSQLVLADQNGEAIIPVIRKGRPAANGGPPMPAFPLPLAD
ncbi:MAG TPA: cytochrome c, partial [Steroidobacteraceae bacterium]|nr:cytochrome c [Steroidobacteraceae bacterium]